MKVELRPYQVEAIDRTMSAMGRGVMRQLGVAATGLGKSQPVDEPVLTPEGWRPIGDMRVGDPVIGSDGKPITVVGVFPQGERPVVRMEFSDGATVRCDEDHLWAVRDKHDVYRGRPWRVMKAKDLEPQRWRVPLVGPVEYAPWPQPLDPYLLGVLMGDGGLSVIGRVFLHTEHALAATLELPAACTLTKLRDDGINGIGGTYIIGGPTGRGENPVLSALRALGLEGRNAKDKRIPPRYLYCSTAADRLELLRGIMDTDGHARPDGHVELTLANKGLADDVVNLVRSLGGTARVKTKITRWTHNDERRTGFAWRVSIALDVCPFRWKANRWRPRTKYHPSRRLRRIVPDGRAECVCISVDAADQLYVTTDYVLTHNTVMFSALAERMDCRTLILAHRDELIEQAVDKMLAVWPEAQVGVVKAERNEAGHQVVVASVQTLARPNRLAKLLPGDGVLSGMVEPFGLVIVDEAHHAAAASYRGILDAMGAGQPGGPLVLGVTATPDRGDGKGLDDLFDEIAWSYDLLWGIRMNYLCDLRGLEVKVDRLNFDDVKVRRGDYDQGQAGAAMMQADTPRHIVNAWLEHALGRRTIVFTPTIVMAEAVRDEFEVVGVKVGFVSGKTPIDERRATLAAYGRGDIDVIANCAVLTEGFDEPRTDCIVVARPTQSRALYTQMIGRGTRRHPDKTDCLVLDIVGASAEHSLVTVPSLFGIGEKRSGKMRDGSGSLIDIVDEQEQEQVRAGVLRAEEVALFHQVRSAGVAWIVTSPEGAQLRRYTRPLGMSQDKTADRGTVVLAQFSEDEWTSGIQYADGSKRVLLLRTSMEMAQGAAEDYVRKVGGAIGTSDAPWRKRKPSPKQRQFAKRLRIAIAQDMTAGEVADLIDQAKARGR